MPCCANCRFRVAPQPCTFPVWHIQAIIIHYKSRHAVQIIIHCATTSVLGHIWHIQAIHVHHAVQVVARLQVICCVPLRGGGFMAPSRMGLGTALGPAPGTKSFFCPFRCSYLFHSFVVKVYIEAWGSRPLLLVLATKALCHTSSWMQSHLG